MSKRIQDTYFIIQKGTNLFLDTDNKFTCRAPYSDKVYSTQDKAAASALIVAQNIQNCDIANIPRYVEVK
jgi:hypothetical protein